MARTIASVTALAVVVNSHSYSDDCVCTDYPIMPYSGDLWMYYATVEDDTENGNGECDILYPTSVICDINACGFTADECQEGDCNTCDSLGGDLSLREFANAANQFEIKGDPFPADANVLDQLPSEVKDEDGNLLNEKHRELFTQDDVKTLEVKRQIATGDDSIYIRVATLHGVAANGVKLEMNLGMEIEKPRGDIDDTVANKQCSRVFTTATAGLGDSVPVPIVGALMVKQGKKIYLVRLTNSAGNRDANAFPTRRVNIGRPAIRQP